MTHPLDVPLTWPGFLSGATKHSSKRVRFSEIKEEVESNSEEEPSDVSHLLGLKEWADYDPATPSYVDALNGSTNSELYAYMELTNHRFLALRTKVRALELKVSSYTSVEQKLKYVYAWIKGAARANVFKLKAAIM
ncbi:hypothetical protein LCGC14_2774990 [marine sediment metagenome]|uniref:Uncharacterized protein n=1 Tax=marine sediment metagenome TaxID=412755 RepID=A0A0F9B3P2_9ZZZZ